MLLDTSGLFNLFHRDEDFHLKATEYFGTATNRVSHSYVLAEFVALANARRLPRLPALRFIADFQNSSDIEVVWVNHDLHRRSLDFLVNRADKEWSLCDAAGFVLMEERGIKEALTTDHHFEQAGFVRLLK